MKRRILLVDDEVAVLLTMKAVLEISGFEVDTAASAREGKLKLRGHEYQMIITDMRMESDLAGREVIQAARQAAYHPAIALLTAFPVDEGDWQEMHADKVLLKPMHTRVLLQQIDALFESHAEKMAKLLTANPAEPVKPAAGAVIEKKKLVKGVAGATKSVTKVATKKSVTKAATKKTATKTAAKKSTTKTAAKKSPGRAGAKKSANKIVVKNGVKAVGVKAGTKAGDKPAKKSAGGVGKKARGK